MNRPRPIILRGAYGPYRANNDLLFYHLDIRVDPEKKFISGKNTIRFKMLKDDARIQLDLAEPLKIDKIQANTDWQTMRTSLEKNEFEVATDLYFVDVVKQ